RQLYRQIAGFFPAQDPVDVGCSRPPQIFSVDTIRGQIAARDKEAVRINSPFANSIRVRSISSALCTPAAVAVTPKGPAAASAVRTKAVLAAIPGSWRTATLLTEGASCLSTSNHFAAIAGSKL